MARVTHPTGQVSGPRLATMLGDWRRPDARPAATDLAATLRLLLLDGRLPPGTRLPSERELAAATGTSRTLATGAYDRLRAAGLLASRRGAGSWTTLPGADRGEPIAAGSDDLVDLAHAAPPAPAGLAAAAEAVRPAFAAHLGGHGYHPHGLPDLRARIAARYTGRGLPTSAEQIMITHGAQHAFALVLRALTAPGDRVLVEQPTYPNALDAIRAAYARAVPVALDPEAGWDVEALDAALRHARPALAYLIPDFQNPTGLQMPAGTRAAVATALGRTPVVIDETLVELGLDAPADRPLAADCGAQAITVGSASKTFWGGLRLGWVRAPAAVAARLVAARPATDLGCPVFEQLLLAELLDRREVLLAGRLHELRTARAALLDALDLHCPQWTVRAPAGGLSLWCRLDAPGSTRLAVAAVAHGVRLVPGSRFSAHGGLERWVRLPYTLPAAALPGAIERVARAWADAGPGGTDRRVPDAVTGAPLA